MLSSNIRISDVVHESKYPHAFWRPVDVHAFRFEPFHESFCGLSLSLLDVMNLYGVLDVLLLLREVSQELFPSSTDLFNLALILSFTCLCRGVTSGPSPEWLLRQASSFCRTTLNLRIEFLCVFASFDVSFRHRLGVSAHPGAFRCGLSPS
ncbi:hypothetical protein Tco_1368906 [Tanacetum coccineum]